MPQDATCPKCNHVFPVTQDRQPVGVDCPRCDTELTVEFSKRPAPVEPGDPPYVVAVKKGRPAASTAPPPPPTPKKQKRLDDEEEEEEKSTGNGGSMLVVVFATITAMLFALGGLGATGYFLFTNLDTTEFTLNHPSKPNDSFRGSKPANKQGGTPGTPSSGNQPVTNQPATRKNVYEHKPVSGPIQTIKAPTLPAAASTLPLGSRVGAAVIAGGGRYIVMHFPDEGKLGIFDASTAVMSKTPSDPGEVKLAAGLTRVVALVPSANAMRLFSIVEPKTADQQLTLAKQFDAPIPVIGLNSIAMGSKTNGPLIGVDSSGTLRIMDITASGINEIEEARNDKLELPTGSVIFRAAPDCMAFVACNNLERGNNVRMAFWDGKQWRKREIGMAPFPGQDGLFYGNGAVTNQRGNDQSFGGAGSGSGEWFVPAVCGSTGAFLKVMQTSGGKGPGARKIVTVTIHEKGNAGTLVEGSQPLSGLPEFDGLLDPSGNASRLNPLDQRLFLFPEAQLLAILSTSRDKLLLRKVDLK
ncbi:MAG TPA: hypothetical protein VG097_18345 [Gemmata sp.]|jgi:hypothetical protein|nr:hypothetical protein [Gemmata sp.]